MRMNNELSCLTFHLQLHLLAYSQLYFSLKRVSIDRLHSSP
jgi:hypothetical protein